MKNDFRTGLALLLVVLIVLVSCQNDENSSYVNPEALGKSSQLTSLLKRVAQARAVDDNVLDSATCFKIKLPINLAVNGQFLSVQNEDDYINVAEIFNASNVDEDYIEFNYPLLINYNENGEQSIAGQEDLESLRQTCPIPDGAAPIGCLKLSFPFNISLYNANSQNPQVVTIANDYDLLAFIVNLGAAQYFQINYPLQATLNNLPIEISNNTELTEQINNAVANCGCDNPNVLTDDLTVYIPFAGEVKDLTGFAVPVLFGSTHYVTDRTGNLNGAISFDTNDLTSRIEVPISDSNMIDIGQAFSVSLWFKRQDTNPAGMYEGLFEGQNFALKLGNTIPEQKGPVIFYQGNASLFDFSWVADGFGTDTNNWHHFVVTYNGETALTLYRDGEYVNQMGATELSILGMVLGGNFKGYLDDLRVYKKALEMDEIQTLYELEGDTSHCLE